MNVAKSVVSVGYKFLFGQKSDPVVTKSTDSRQPGKPVVEDIGCDYISISWEKPQENEVSYYEIKMKRVSETAWSKIPLTTDDNSTYKTISDLTKDTAYEFKVRALYEEEEGPFSEKSDPVVTKAMAMKSANPRQPGKPVVQDVGCDFISISWEKPQHNDVSYYEIKMKQTSETAWSKFPLFTDDNSTCKTISGLTQDTAYEFKVRAHFEEEAGTFSEKTDPIVTKSSGTTESEDKFGKRAAKEPGEGKISTKPGKPNQTSIGSDFVLLFWGKPECKDVLYYEVKYKSLKDSYWKKNSILTKDNKPTVRIEGLLQQTEYVFKVKAQFENSEGEFSEESFPIQTKPSPSIQLLCFCTKLKDGEPSLYKLPLTEMKAARNDKYQTRKCEFGSSKILHDKTIMMIGATGSGKSTLIDGMVNYLLGVKWEDNFRFKIIDLMSEEETKQGRESESQTDWITSYRFHPLIEDVGYVLNIIDTPGFGDTRGFERDNELVEQIQAFFSTKGIKGIETIDAVCFVTQAPLARMTHAQRYIFNAILSIFGKDIARNIVVMITFADGKEPPVLNALRDADFPYNKHFVFNNSALFEPNTEGNCSNFSQMFWEMGRSSFKAFFTHINTLNSQSLQLTAEVLRIREQMKTTIQGLVPQIENGLHELSTMKNERDLVEKFEREIQDNKNFTYTAEEFHQTEVALEAGQYVTNCTFCNMTCHFPCYIPESENKFCCSAMDNGVCTICPKNCSWKTHRNNDFRIEVTSVLVEKTYEEMKKKYEFAAKRKITKEKLVKKIKEKFVNVKDVVCKMLMKVRETGNYLRKNALKANPLTEVEYLEMLINTQLHDRKHGFEQRIKMLEMLKKQAELVENAINIDNIDELLKYLGFD